MDSRVAQLGGIKMAYPDDFRAKQVSAQHFNDKHEQELYGRLLCKALGDHALVNRLLRYEAERDPNAGRALLIQRAIWRWESDINRWR
jgi:hypothetical protein